MKKMTLSFRSAVCPFLALVMAGGVLASCNKENSDPEIQLPEDYEENTELPTTDQLDRIYSGKAVVLGGSTSGFNAPVVNRMKNAFAAISADAKAFVFTTGYEMEFTDDELKAMLLAYDNDASFVCISPVFPDMTAFSSQVSAVSTALIESGSDFDIATGQEFCSMLEQAKAISEGKVYDATEAVAFRASSVYAVRDLEDMAEESGSNASGYYSDDETTAEQDCVTVDYEPTDYDYGKSADLLVEWMESDEDFGQNDGATAAIDKYMSGHRTVVQHKVGPSRALNRTLTYEMVYTVYSAYDFDNDVDYYFIRLEPNFHCSALGCKNGNNEWVSANKVVVFDDGKTSGNFWSSRTDLWYGPYLSKFDYTAKIVDENMQPVSVTLLDATPHTDVSGSVGYSTGFSKSLSGNLGFNSNGLTGGISGGLSFSESHSHSESSLKVYHSDKDCTPNWRIEGIVPQCHMGWMSYYHDEVATFQKSDWQTEFTWVVSVADPQPGQPYYVLASDLAEITELNYNIYDYELRVHPTQSAKILLDEPNRSNEKYIMYCSDETVQNLIKDQFSQTWQNEFTYYALNKEQSDLGAKSMFEKAKAAVKGYASVLKGKGYTGTYTFTLSKIDGTQMSSFTLENGEVK